MRRSLTLRHHAASPVWHRDLRALAGLAVSQMLAACPPTRSPRVTPRRLLTEPIADSAPNAAQLRRGQYLVAAGDCMSCHLRDGGEPFAGGLGLNTPFGVIYSPNITSDRRHRHRRLDRRSVLPRDARRQRRRKARISIPPFPIPGSGASAAKMMMRSLPI